MITKGKLLRLLRLSLSIRQDAAAAKAGISPSYLSLIEAGKKQPSNGMLNLLADTYGIPSILLYWNDDDLKRTESKEEKAIVTSINECIEQLFSLILSRKQ